MTDAARQTPFTIVYGPSAKQARSFHRFGLFACMAILAMAPFPLGSARPAAWIAWAMVVGLVAVIYVGGRLLAGADLMVVPRRMRAVSLMFGLFCTALIVQAVPLGTLFGGVSFVAPDGAVFTSDSLSLSPGATFLMLLRMITFALFFLIIAETSLDSRTPRTLLRWLLAIAVSYALVGLFFLRQGDTFIGMEKWAYAGSATASFVNRNSFATFLSFGLVLGVAQLCTELRDLSRERFVSPLRTLLRSRAAYVGTGLIIIIAALIATQSRMGVLSGVVGMGVVLVATAVHQRPTAGMAAVAAVVTALIVTLLVVGFGSGLMERLGSLDTDAGGRAALYEQIVGMIASRPWTGFGGGSFELAFPLFHQLPVAPDVTWDKAHSTYLALWSEMGVVIGSLPLVIYGMLVLQAVRLLMARKGQGLVAVSALGCVAVAATHSLVDFSLEIQANTFVLLAVLALLPSTIIRYEGYRA